ncbi:HIT family protein [Halomonas organivorans]|uniref:Diadenosine tetraphosphate (Ap4A) HIT family hydrolase n=1 Tax=Halomonas organivorans TaxID=257772 RepID=A0A7W5G6Q6_9GAMM|nr:HIT family protein [Halomonas organivorans]MBB3142400.1 diadenosine tetraphosphate (Ap4A) HIT family hydrolase [Halomonas organivorans]
MSDFEPDSRLVEDSYPVTELPLCQLRLMNDTRYPWLVLIPRRQDVVEVFDLDDDAQQRLWQEAGLVGRALKETLGGDKLNIATLGNMVPQLHVHVILRRQGDDAWPGPVWGQGTAEPYDLDALAAMRDRLLAMVEGIDALQQD